MLELDVDQVGLDAVRPGGHAKGACAGSKLLVSMAQGVVRHFKHQPAVAATHCQKVSLRPSLSCSTPLPGLAVLTDHEA